MEIEFDPAKDVANFRKHGISLARAPDLQIKALRLLERGGERRVFAVGVLDGQYYALVFVFRRNAARAISLRRAHMKEVLDVLG